MAPSMKSNMMMVAGVVTLIHAKLLNLFHRVILKLFNAMEKLWDFNNNVTMMRKKHHLVIPTALISTEIWRQADHTWTSAKTTGNNDFLNVLRSEMKFLYAAA